MIYHTGFCFPKGKFPKFFTYENGREIYDWFNFCFAKSSEEVNPSDCLTSLSFWLGIEGADNDD